jgi:hypothetical protein
MPDASISLVIGLGILGLVSLFAMLAFFFALAIRNGQK